MIFSIVITLWCLWQRVCHFYRSVQLACMLRGRPVGFRRKVALPEKRPIRFQPKSAWVKREVLRLKALMPHKGGRKIADTFNRLYHDKKQMTVGKSYVCETVKKHFYEIQVLRRNIKHRKPKPLPRNCIWQLDLTQLRDTDNTPHTLFGIVDSGTRACLSLKYVSTKASIVLLRSLLDTIERYGKPKIVRTDNEAVFVSKLFRLGLWLLGIKHQRTQVSCPWQNGKIERFFGTLKEKLKHYSIPAGQLATDLRIFRLWYNHIRTHQYLDGKTPAEVWNREQPNPQGKYFYFNAWDDTLTGLYLPPT